MNNYTIYCSGDQTKKALELGAPIQYASIIDIRLNRFVNSDKEEYALPTTEQMIGWLEEQGIGISIKEGLDCWFYLITDNKNDIEQWERPTRKEATLAAIDTAIEYLIMQKQ